MIDEYTHDHEHTTITELNETQQPQLREKRRSLTPLPLEIFNKKYPRSFYLFFYVLIPLWVLVGVSFVCGYMLAVIETPYEVERNDSILRARYNVSISERINGQDVQNHFVSTSDWCLDHYGAARESSGTFNLTDIKIFVNNCENFEAGDLRNDFHDLISTAKRSVGDLTFHWTRCQYEDTELHFSLTNEIVVNDTFFKNFNQLILQARQNENPEIIVEEGLMKLSGHEDCRPNVAGAAWFWFTIMTTIGYGNVALVTEMGRSLVYTAGFLSILLFTAVSGQAGYVSLAVADDWFRNHKLNFFTKGAGASLFWLILYNLWNAIISFIFKAMIESRTNRQFSYKNGFWFAYISTTTIGFGDYYVPHPLLKPGDLFYLPICFLTSFVLLANFLIKFADWASTLLSAQKVGLGLKNLNEALELLSQTENLRREQAQERTETT